jgi:sulfite exporter TauE/SafE
VLLGAIVGGLGAAANLKGLQKYLSYVAGGMLILISLLQLTPVMQIHFLSRAQTFLRNLLTRAAGKAGPGRFTLLGVANGFLPCGMVAMALMASIAAGTLTDGVLYMLFFGLGTFPLMLAASLFGVYLRPKLRGFLTIAGPVYGIALGILLLLRPGWILPDCN